MDTATPVTGVAVGSEAGTLAEVAVRHERRHAEVLTPAVRWVLEQAEVDPGALAGVAVGTGPGLFTGLRVGVSTAKALAQAWGLPMVAVPSLDLIAFAHRHVHRAICPVIDARRGEVFCALYRHAPGGVVRLTDYQVLRPDQLAAGIEARGEEVLLCGDGALLYREAFEHLGEQSLLGGLTQSSPSAAALVELALPRMLREQFTSPLEVTPLYLRRPDIDPGVERRLANEAVGGPDGDHLPAPALGRRPAAAARDRAGPDAPPPHPPGAGHRAPGLPAAVDDDPVPVRDRAALDPLLHRGQGPPAGRRLCRPDGVRGRGARDQHRRRPRPTAARSPPGCCSRWSPRPGAGARPPARSRSGWPTTPPRACTTSSASPRSGSARTTTPRPARTP